MCYRINITTSVETREVKRSKTPLKLYKVVRIKRVLGKNQYISSVVGGYSWKKGLNKSDRRTNRITPAEHSYGEIGRGFHFYRSLETANAIAHGDNPLRIIECEVLPEWVVAADSDTNYTIQVVATCAKFIRVIPKRPLEDFED